MSYNTKNYTEQGGATTHIGGSLVIDDGGSVTGLDATTSKKGLVKQGVAVAAAAGTAPTKAEFDALVTSLKNAGIIASS